MLYIKSGLPVPRNIKFESNEYRFPFDFADKLKLVLVLVVVFIRFDQGIKRDRNERDKAKRKQHQR